MQRFYIGFVKSNTKILVAKCPDFILLLSFNSFYSYHKSCISNNNNVRWQNSSQAQRIEAKKEARGG